MTAVLVAGAASGIGASIVRSLLGDGATTVFATSRTRERLDTLCARLESDARARLVPIVGDAGDFAGAQGIADQVMARGGVDAAIAILGRGWWTSGPLLDVTPEVWNAIVAEMLTSHFAFARAIVPMLAIRPESCYLSIGGGAAFEPMLDAGLVSIAAAGQVMLTRVLAREWGAKPPRIVELVVNGPVKTSESQHFAQPHWITDDDVGTTVSEIILRGGTTWPATSVRGSLIVMNERRSFREELGPDSG
jgi:NAD(P)-dependent dehydrogenase (short-subunit alcohol dehydrogenase family)